MTTLWSRDREIQEIARKVPDPLSMKAGSGNETRGFSELSVDTLDRTSLQLLPVLLHCLFLAGLFLGGFQGKSRIHLEFVRQSFVSDAHDDSVAQQLLLEGSILTCLHHAV